MGISLRHVDSLSAIRRSVVSRSVRIPVALAALAVAILTTIGGLVLATSPAHAQAFEEARLLPFYDLSEDFDLLNDPFALTVDSSGTVFVINVNGSYIEALPAGGAPQRLDPLYSFGIAETIASEGAGDLLVGGAVEREGLIQRVPPSGEPETLPATGLTNVTDLAADASGDVFAVGTGVRGVIELLSDGTVQILPISGNAPSAIALSPSGNLVVADYSITSPYSPQIEEVNLGGAPPRLIIPPAFFFRLSDVTDIAFDSAGDLFIAGRFGGTIMELPKGAESPVDLTLTAPYGLAKGHIVGITFDRVGNLFALYQGAGFYPPHPSVVANGYVLEAPVAPLGPPPAITAVTPAYGREVGGDSVNIRGENLFQVEKVSFGETPASSFVVNSPTSITATAPPGSGAVDVTLVAPQGASAISPADRFSYVPAGPSPVVKKLSVKHSPPSGGGTITITGSGFNGVTSVRFGTSETSSFSAAGPTSITATIPAGTSGPAYVSVTTPNGTTTAGSHDLFKYSGPTITGISPTAGPIVGGTSVTITGAGFAPGAGTSFVFGKAPAVAVDCSSSTSCTAVTPGTNRPASVDVRASVGSLKSKATPATDQYRYF